MGKGSRLEAAWRIAVQEISLAEGRRMQKLDCLKLINQRTPSYGWGDVENLTAAEYQELLNESG